MKYSRYLYSENDLGATLHPDGTATFKLWSPSVKRVILSLYSKNDYNRKLNSFDLEKDEEGIWSTTLHKDNCGIDDLNGFFYQYEITHKNGKVKHGLDPYAKSMAPFNPECDVDNIGKAAIVSLDSHLAGNRPNSIGDSNLATPTDMVAYEIHVRDFTINLDIPDAGTFSAFANWEEGIKHLKELGITHVQLLPVQNYFTVNETDKFFKEKGAKYNWGYDPHNYFSLEGWLAADTHNPYGRIREFRDLVNKLHENGIGVIIDVVYNHTYGTEIFENIAPGCYYRTYDGIISGKTGAGPTLESRAPMVRKLIIDSMKYFVDEFGIDGFRFDLMGFIDSETISIIRKELGDSIILHGEAWNFTDLPLEEAPIKGIPATFPHDINLGVFNDSTRDFYTGRLHERGFVQGEYHMAPVVRAGIIGNIVNYFDQKISLDTYHRFAISPVESLQFVSIHDGFTLWDKLNLTIKGGERDINIFAKQSLALLLLSQGKIILQGGTEIGHTKPLGKKDPEPHRAHSSELITPDEEFPTIRHFHENSYSSSDFVNQIRWNRKNRDYIQNLYAYTKGLIELRRSSPGFRFAEGRNIRKGIKFIGYDHPHSYSFIAYTVDNTLDDSYGKDVTPTPYKEYIVVHNASYGELKFKHPEISPNWDLLVDNINAGITPILDSKVKVEFEKVTIPPHTTIVLGIKEGVEKIPHDYISEEENIEN